MTFNTDNSSRAQWTPELIAVLLDELITQAALGKQSDNSFKSEVWEGAKNGLNQQCSTKFTTAQIKTMWLNLRPKYVVMKALRQQSGFGWNDLKQTVEAEPSVWDAYLASHPKAKEFQNKPFPLYNKMEQLCDGKVATGENAMTISQASAFAGILYYEINSNYSFCISG